MSRHFFVDSYLQVNSSLLANSQRFSSWFAFSHLIMQVIILWTANTERFCDVRVGLNDTADNLLASIARNEKEVSPSTLFAVASALEGVSNSCVHHQYRVLYQYKNTFIFSGTEPCGPSRMYVK